MVLGKIGSTLRKAARIACLTMGVLALLFVSDSVRAQTMLQGLDLTSPAMTEAEMSREDVEAALAAAETPLDLTGKRLNGLDLSGLDLSGVILRSGTSE